MRVATKEFLPQNTNHVARPSVKVIVKRYMPKNRRYTVETWSGWPTDLAVCHTLGTDKCSAVELAKQLACKYSR